MADTYLALLSGGPCDGKVKKLTATQFKSGHTTCSGQTYIKTDSFLRGSGEWVFEYQAGASTGSAGGDTVAPQTHKGWNALRKLSSHTIPSTLRQSRSATTKALHDLSRLPKVRGR